MFRVLVCVALLVGCSSLTSERTPRNSSCEVVCKECKHVELTCAYAGHGEKHNDTKVELP